MSFITDMLMRLARAVLGNILSQLTQQLNVVNEQGLDPMRAIIEQVTAGSWVGKGADAFVEEVSSLMIPGVGKVGEHISTMSQNLRSAQDTIEHADDQVGQLVEGGLSEVFKFY
jgi:uncharacterized protein YukE